MISEFTENMNGKVLELQSDYSKKYQPQPDGDFQSQYFNKQNSLSMEGHAARYWNAQKEKNVLNYYSALSDEKRQGGGTTEVERSAKEHGAMKITNKDHSSLMQRATERSPLNYEDYVNDFDSDGEDPDSDEEDGEVELSEVEGEDGELSDVEEE